MKQETNVRIGVISDTHGVVRPSVHKAFKGVDQILHAGDIDTPDVILELDAIAPVTAVRGNMDSYDLFPHLQEQLQLNISGVTILLTHNYRRLRSIEKDVSLVIHGHTHNKTWRRNAANNDETDLEIPGLSPRGFILNPGVAGPRTHEPTVAILSLAKNSIGVDFCQL